MRRVPARLRFPGVPVACDSPTSGNRHATWCVRGELQGVGCPEPHGLRRSRYASRRPLTRQGGSPVSPPTTAFRPRRPNQPTRIDGLDRHAQHPRPRRAQDDCWGPDRPGPDLPPLHPVHPRPPARDHDDRERRSGARARGRAHSRHESRGLDARAVRRGDRAHPPEGRRPLGHDLRGRLHARGRQAREGAPARHGRGLWRPAPERGGGRRDAGRRGRLRGAWRRGMDLRRRARRRRGRPHRLVGLRGHPLAQRRR